MGSRSDHSDAGEDSSPGDDSERERLVPWGPTSGPGQAAAWVAMFTFVAYIVYHGVALGYLLVRDGLPESWTLPNIAAFGYTAFSALIIVALGVTVAYLFWSRSRAHREMDDVLEEFEEGAATASRESGGDEPAEGESDVVFEFDADEAPAEHGDDADESERAVEAESAARGSSEVGSN